MFDIDGPLRGKLEKRIVGALKSAIDAHGPITKDMVGSAAKRVLGTLKAWNREAALPHIEGDKVYLDGIWIGEAVEVKSLGEWYAWGLVLRPDGKHLMALGEPRKERQGVLDILVRHARETGLLGGV